MNFDASDHEYFNAHIGKSLELYREQKLCLIRDNINYRAFRTIGLSSPTEACDVKEIVTLPIGTKVKIQSVKRHWVPVSGSSWYALGQTTIDAKTYEFEYFYGYLHIRRAPWDSNDIPLKRNVPE